MVKRSKYVLVATNLYQTEVKLLIISVIYTQEMTHTTGLCLEQQYQGQDSFIQSLIVGDSINHFLSLFLYVNSLGLTVSLKITNVSGFKLMGISSTFFYQLSNTLSQITSLYTSPKHRFTCSSEEDIIQSSRPSGLGSFV